ncbi:tyrosine-type recombinase/integrase [Sporichthya polymorpha]|uniref:tyrosine-type recombinase/integrase n=1 Tax=Sporichthya polymorpha TaxID=35751 RepID=UPI00035E7231|nr:site-specific integrase [Sporichthya polymorpha]
MAFLVERNRRGGVAYQVRWRQDGAWQSDIFDTKRKALRFKCDVEDAGNQWPEGWVPGYGYAATSAAAEPGVETAFAALAEQYLNTRTSVSSYQMTRYRGMVRRLGEHFTVVEDIDDQAVATWVRDMLDTGSAAKTIANYHGLLFAICAYGVRKGMLGANPCADTRLPKLSAYDAEGEPIACFLEPAEFALIAEAMCASSAYDWRPPGGPGERRAPSQVVRCGVAFREDRDLITLVVHTGLRWGEISALRVGDVDLDARRLSVKRAWKRDGELNWVIGPPKTARSRRTISISSSLVELLRPHLDGRSAREYIFRNGNGEPIRQNSFYEHRWQRAVALARTRGLDKSPRFHDLRHTHVAWLIAGGTPLPKIQQRLGHESIQTTIDVYGGLLADTDDQVDAVIDAAFNAVLAVAG